MSNLLKIVIAGIVVAVAATGVVLIARPAAAPAPTTQNVGAIAGPDFATQYISWGNVVHWAFSEAMNTGSSTVCAFKSPAATSTLSSATMRIDSSPGYATTYEIGNGTSANATTTAIVASYSLVSGAQGNVVATTTVTALTDGIVNPNTWVNFNLSTSTATGASAATGFCAVTFRQI